MRSVMQENRCMNKIRVGIGEGSVAKAPGVIIAEGLGSCVALALYNVKHGLGGMAHILLPTSLEYKSGKTRVFSPYLYADTAIDALLKELHYEGGSHNAIAKMVGGACMFPVYNGTYAGIGEQNITVIRRILKKMFIPVAGEDVGGTHGRSVEFYLDSGRVVVKALGKDDMEI